MTDDQTPAQNDTGAPEAEAADELALLRAELDDWRDKALRAAAEVENVRRRAERENNDARAYAIQKFARDLFQVADNLERALLAAPRETPDTAVKNFVVGVEMTEKALQNAFQTNGLKRIDPGRGGKFDPHLHQAMMEQDDPEVEPGAVVQVMQAGYELFGRVVRPAMVVVAAKRASAAPQEAQANPYGQAGAAEAGGAVDTKA